MPNQIYILLGVLLGLGLIFSGISLRYLLSRRVLVGSFNTILAALLLSLFAAGILLLANIYTYQQFTQETPVATLRFQAINQNSFRVHVHDIAQNKGRPFVIHGELWQLDARVLKWKNSGTLLGLKPLYRLERISGRYEEGESEANMPKSAHRLTHNAGIELWKAARSIEPWLPLLDVVYGSASYMPMADEAYYEVSISSSGLIARPANSAAKNAVLHWD